MNRSFAFYVAMASLSIIALLCVCFVIVNVWPPASQKTAILQQAQPTPHPPSATVIGKAHVDGYSYPMTARTGARTVTMPFKVPGKYWLFIAHKYRDTDTVEQRTVTYFIYRHKQKGDTISLK